MKQQLNSVIKKIGVVDKEKVNTMLFASSEKRMWAADENWTHSMSAAAGRIVKIRLF